MLPRAPKLDPLDQIPFSVIPYVLMGDKSYSTAEDTVGVFKAPPIGLFKIIVKIHNCTVHN